MPTTLVGLLVFVVLLTPGFLGYLQRKKLVPTRALSPLVETATLTTVSVLTNLIALAVFGLLRLALPGHTPDVGRLLRCADEYLIAELPYVLSWAASLLAFSSLLAIALGSRSKILARLQLGRLTPVIVDVSAWYRIFEAQPEKRVYVGCDLHDGTYVAGILAWYSTETAETGDRDLVVGPPLTKVVDGDASSLDVSRVVISARDVSTMYVTYLD